MGTEILEGILDELFNTNTIIEEYMNMLNYNTVFNCLEEFQNNLGVDVGAIINVVFSYAFSLLMLKFVWKCFNIYILNTDGDEDAAPRILLINFGKAVVCSLAFGILFSYLCQIGSGLTQNILSHIKTQEVSYSDALDKLIIPGGVKAALTTRMFFGVFTILAIVLSVKFVTSAVQLVILRIGIAFAAVGFLDSDQGVFRPYIKKFFQIAFAVVIQVTCFRLSMYAVYKASFIWAYALISMAMAAPAFLQEFIMVGPNGGGKVHQAIQSISIVRSLGKVK